MRVRDFITIVIISSVSSMLSALVTCMIININKPDTVDYIPVMVMEHQRSIRI